jgi:hypothetical protein
MLHGFPGGLVGPLPSVLDEDEGDDDGKDPESPAPDPVEAGIGADGVGTRKAGGSTMVELEPAGAAGGVLGV